MVVSKCVGPSSNSERRVLSCTGSTATAGVYYCRHRMPPMLDPDLTKGFRCLDIRRPRRNDLYRRLPLIFVKYRLLATGLHSQSLFFCIDEKRKLCASLLPMPKLSAELFPPGTIGDFHFTCKNWSLSKNVCSRRQRKGAAESRPLGPGLTSGNAISACTAG